jgi:hypothetical protein
MHTPVLLFPRLVAPTTSNSSSVVLTISPRQHHVRPVDQSATSQPSPGAAATVDGPDVVTVPRTRNEGSVNRNTSDPRRAAGVYGHVNRQPPVSITTVMPVCQMRTIAGIGGENEMANPTPLTANIVALLSDARYRARVLYMAHNDVDEQVAPILQLLDLALVDAQELDEERLEAIYKLNTGKGPTDWHARKRRERRTVDSIA